jgi:hypothetical protein
MKAADLDGHIVLLLMIDRSVSDETGFAAGRAKWTASGLQVAIAGTGEPISVRQVDVERGGFAPERLGRLIATKSVQHIAEECAAGASWCIPMFVETMPAKAEILTCIFAGMARGKDGEVLIMQPPRWLDPNGAP